jgi:AbiTii
LAKTRIRHSVNLDFRFAQAKQVQIGLLKRRYLFRLYWWSTPTCRDVWFPISTWSITHLSGPRIMPLLDDIIEAAIDDKVGIGSLLRTCLVLESQIKNDKFRAWLNLELDGYDRDHEGDFPDYRVFNCVNRGDFLGLTVKMTDQPISLHVMDERDRKMLAVVHLHQPAASYEGRKSKDTDAALPWNPTITTKYQGKIYQNGEPTLIRAWQEIPGSVLVGLLEQVRTRVLRFALELKDNLPVETDSAKQLPAAVVERSVINNIYGGNNIIASHSENFALISQTNVHEGNMVELEAALANLGITHEGIAALRSDMEADKKDGQSTVGPKTKHWLADMGKYLAKEGAKAGFEVAKQAATKWILQHYGLGV